MPKTKATLENFKSGIYCEYLDISIKGDLIPRFRITEQKGGEILSSKEYLSELEAEKAWIKLVCKEG